MYGLQFAAWGTYVTICCAGGGGGGGGGGGVVGSTPSVSAFCFGNHVMM